MRLMSINQNTLEYISDENLVLFHSNEFITIYKGGSEYELLTNGVRSTAIKQGLLTRYSYPSKQRLTEKAINILVKHKLITVE